MMPVDPPPWEDSDLPKAGDTLLGGAEETTVSSGAGTAKVGRGRQAPVMGRRTL